MGLSRPTTPSIGVFFETWGKEDGRDRGWGDSNSNSNRCHATELTAAPLRSFVFSHLWSLRTLPLRLSRLRKPVPSPKLLVYPWEPCKGANLRG